MENYQLFDQLFLYNKTVFRICLGFTKNPGDARDLTQEVYLKAYRKLEHIKDLERKKEWLFMIARNTCIDHVRKAKKKRTVELATAAEVAIPSSVLDKIAAEDLLAMLQKLAPMTRAVFSLYVIEGFKHAEIAEQLGMSEGTSRWHLSSGKQELKRLLQNYDLH